MSASRFVRGAPPNISDSTGPLLHRGIGILFRFVDITPVIVVGWEVITILEMFLSFKREWVQPNEKLIRVLRDTAQPFASDLARHHWNGFSEVEDKERIERELQALIFDGALDGLEEAASEDMGGEFRVEPGLPMLNSHRGNGRNGRESPPPAVGILIPSSGVDGDSSDLVIVARGGDGPQVDDGEGVHLVPPVSE